MLKKATNVVYIEIVLAISTLMPYYARKSGVDAKYMFCQCGLRIQALSQIASQTCQSITSSVLNNIFI